MIVFTLREIRCVPNIYIFDTGIFTRYFIKGGVCIIYFRMGHSLDNSYYTCWQHNKITISGVISTKCRILMPKMRFLATQNVILWQRGSCSHFYGAVKLVEIQHSQHDAATLCFCKNSGR